VRESRPLPPAPPLPPLPLPEAEVDGAESRNISQERHTSTPEGRGSLHNDHVTRMTNKRAIVDRRVRRFDFRWTAWCPAWIAIVAVHVEERHAPAIGLIGGGL